MISFQYWRQGFGNNFVQSLIGPNFVFRANKVFTASVGLGYVLGTNPLSIVLNNQIILTYAVGAHIPF
jgi:hypothetical protein